MCNYKISEDTEVLPRDVLTNGHYKCKRESETELCELHKEDVEEQLEKNSVENGDFIGVKRDELIIDGAEIDTDIYFQKSNISEIVIKDATINSEVFLRNLDDLTSVEFKNIRGSGGINILESEGDRIGFKHISSGSGSIDIRIGNSEIKNKLYILKSDGLGEIRIEGGHRHTINDLYVSRCQYSDLRLSDQHVENNIVVNDNKRGTLMFENTTVGGNLILENILQGLNNEIMDIEVEEQVVMAGIKGYIDLDKNFDVVIDLESDFGIGEIRARDVIIARDMEFRYREPYYNQKTVYDRRKLDIRGESRTEISIDDLLQLDIISSRDTYYLTTDVNPELVISSDDDSPDIDSLTQKVYTQITNDIIGGSARSQDLIEAISSEVSQDESISIKEVEVKAEKEMIQKITTKVNREVNKVLEDEIDDIVEEKLEEIDEEKEEND